MDDEALWDMVDDALRDDVKAKPPSKLMVQAGTLTLTLQPSP